MCRGVGVESHTLPSYPTASNRAQDDKSSFNDDCLNDDRFKSWLQKRYK